MKEYKHREPMMSVNELEKRYNKLSPLIEIKKYNNYNCPNGHIIKTVDIHEGVTPFMKLCPLCGAMAHSTFYKDNIPDQEPTFEWYRPTLKQCMKLRKEPEMLDHVLNGGLDYRCISKNKK